MISNPIAKIPEQQIAWIAHPGGQSMFLSCPISEILVEGNRSGGKTDALLMKFAQHTGKGYGSDLTGIIFRKTYKQLADLIKKSRKWFTKIFPEAKYNSSDKHWEWPTGEKLIFSYLEKEDDYWNYHGHEYPFIAFEELTAWATSDVYDMMKSCWRCSNPGVPKFYISTTNPYGIGHNWVKKKFIDPAPNCTPIINEEGEKRVRINVVLNENPSADKNYIKTLKAIDDPNKRAAWLYGSWDITSGGMFDDIWNADNHVVPPFEIPKGWKLDRSFDWGSSRPFSVGFWAESDGSDFIYQGRSYKTVRGDLFRIGELYGCEKDKNNVGLVKTNIQMAEMIIHKEKQMGLHGHIKAGPADAQIFGEGNPTIADQMKAAGVRWTKCPKGQYSRKHGWQAVRQRLANSIPKVDNQGNVYPRELPGLFIFSTCDAFFRLFVSAPRCEKDPDDIDTDSEDHLPDEVRYKIFAHKYTTNVEDF